MTCSDPLIISITHSPGLVTIKTESVNQGIQASPSPLALPASEFVSHSNLWDSMGIQIQMAVLCQERGIFRHLQLKPQATSQPAPQQLAWKCTASGTPES